MVDHLTPSQLDARLRADDPPLLVDVREDWERELAVIPGSVHVPMGEIPTRIAELPRDRDVTFYCHHGSRSLQVALWLQAQGYDRLANLEGGIDQWSAHDPEVSRYS
jgi:rhodanese-related sulfurtransferase